MTEKEKLEEEIRKVRGEINDLQSNYESATTECQKVMEENRSISDNNRLLKDHIGNFERQIKKTLENNEDLTGSRRTLCEEMKKLKQDASDQNNLKIKILELEDQIKQLQQDLKNGKILNAQYRQENSELTASLVNANNEVEETAQKLEILKKQIEDATSEITSLKDETQQLTENLRKKQQDTNCMLETLQRNLELTTENNKLKTDLTNVLQINASLDTKGIKNENIIHDLKEKYTSSQTWVEKLKTLNVETLSKRSELITEMHDVETNLHEKITEKDDLIKKNLVLENSLKKIIKDFNNYDKLFKMAEEQLRIALEQELQVKKELNTLNSKEDNRGELDELLLALITCVVISRKALDEAMEKENHDGGSGKEHNGSTETSATENV